MHWLPKQNNDFLELIPFILILEYGHSVELIIFLLETETIDLVTVFHAILTSR